MFLLRVILPDRPGSLGAVATALGAAGADITAVEIVERGPGHVIDDFMLSLPSDARPDTLVTACAQLDDVEVMWVSVYPEHWGLHADVDLLEEMLAAPDDAHALFAEAAPTVFHATWALVLDRATGAVTHRSSLAPDGRLDTERLGDVTTARAGELTADWYPGWGDHELAVAPFPGDSAIVLGRPGPGFRPSEVARLRHLAQLAGDRGDGAAPPTALPE